VKVLSRCLINYLAKLVGTAEGALDNNLTVARLNQDHTIDQFVNKERTSPPASSVVADIRLHGPASRYPGGRKN
jgi:hypothetical protein